MHNQSSGSLDQNLLLQLSILQLRLLPFRPLAHAGAARPSAASVLMKDRRRVLLMKQDPVGMNCNFSSLEVLDKGVNFMVSRKFS